MVDVFVVAVFLVYLTANKGDVSRAEVEVGLYFFLGICDCLYVGES